MGSSVEISWAGFDLGFSVAGLSYAQPTFSVIVPDTIDPATLSPALTAFSGHWTSAMPGFTYVHKVIYFQDLGSNLNHFGRSGDRTGAWPYREFFNPAVVRRERWAVSTVPEPATFLLLATGLAAVAARRRFAKRA